MTAEWGADPDGSEKSEDAASGASGVREVGHSDCGKWVVGIPRITGAKKRKSGSRKKVPTDEEHDDANMTACKYAMIEGEASSRGDIEQHVDVQAAGAKDDADLHAAMECPDQRQES